MYHIIVITTMTDMPRREMFSMLNVPQVPLDYMAEIGWLFGAWRKYGKKGALTVTWKCQWGTCWPQKMRTLTTNNPAIRASHDKQIGNASKEQLEFSIGEFGIRHREEVDEMRYGQRHRGRNLGKKMIISGQVFSDHVQVQSHDP